jgi:hypothetical protein
MPGGILSICGNRAKITQQSFKTKQKTQVLFMNSELAVYTLTVCKNAFVYFTSIFIYVSLVFQ